MRNGGGADAESLAEFTDTKAGTFLHITIVPPTTTREAEKNGEAMGMGEGLEGTGDPANAYISIYIDIS
jgi:hypothetical protein